MSSIQNFDIQKYVTESVIETYSTMLSMEIEPLEQELPSSSGISRMVGSLNFAGQVTGLFNIHVSVDFGSRMAAKMLGIKTEAVQVSIDVRDLIGEMTNIIGGHLKSALNDAGHACMLSTPSITYGTDFSIKSLNMDRFERFAFRSGDHILIVEVGLKNAEGPNAAIDTSVPQTDSGLPHVDLEKLSALDYRARISRTLRDVFESRFSLKIEPVEAVPGPSLSGVRNVFSVCFAGDATGILSLQIDTELCRRMAAQRRGTPPEQVEAAGEIEEMLGELGAIVGADVKSALTDTGLRCSLSTPSLTNGSDFMIESLNLERYERFAFRIESHMVFVEMGVKISELSKAALPGESNRPLNSSETDAPKPTPPSTVPESGAHTVPCSSADSAGGRPDSAPSSAPPLPTQPPAEAQTPSATEDLGLEMLLDIPVELTVELGRTKMPIHELLKLQPGSAVKLARLEGEPVDILASDVLIARGEVVVRSEKYGIRITEITSRLDRLKGLK